MTPIQRRTEAARVNLPAIRRGNIAAGRAATAPMTMGPDAAVPDPGQGHHGGSGGHTRERGEARIRAGTDDQGQGVAGT